MVSNVDYAALIDFTVHSIKAPSTVMDAESIEIKTQTSDSVTTYDIESCSLGVTGFKEDQLKSLDLQIDYTSDEHIALTLDITFPRTITASVFLSVVVPA